MDEFINNNVNFNSTYSPGNPKHVKPELVENYTLADYGLSIDAVKEQMFGMSVVDPSTGKALPNRYYNQAINSAVAYVEKRFDIKILPRFVSEEKDFNMNQVNTFMYTRLVQRPILQVERFVTNSNGVGTFIDFPSQWWKVETIGGTIQVLPGYGMYNVNQLGGNGISGLASLGAASIGQNSMGGFNPAQTGMLGSPMQGNGTYSPQMFHINYIAGMLPPARDGVEEAWEMPSDLLWILLKTAVKDVLQIWSRLILSPGISSSSLTIDGITESKVSTASAMYGGATADILQLDRDIELLSEGLDAKFGKRVSMI